SHSARVATAHRYYFDALPFVGGKKNDRRDHRNHPHSFRHRTLAWKPPNFSRARVDQRLLTTSPRSGSASLDDSRFSFDRRLSSHAAFNPRHLQLFSIAWIDESETDSQARRRWAHFGLVNLYRLRLDPAGRAIWICRTGTATMIGTLDGKIPSGPLDQKWRAH